MKINEGIVNETREILDPYQGIETFHCPLEAISAEDLDGADPFLCITGDNGFSNVEIRVPFSALESNGWTRPEAEVEGESSAR